jgi:hypothetical protein
MRQLRPGHQGLVCEAAWWSLWRFTPTRLGVSSAMDESRVAVRTPAAWGPVRLDALTPPVHACSPRVGVCTPPLIGPGQGTPPQSPPHLHAHRAPRILRWMVRGPRLLGDVDTTGLDEADEAIVIRGAPIQRVAFLATDRVPDRSLGARAGHDLCGCISRTGLDIRTERRGGTCALAAPGRGPWPAPRQGGKTAGSPDNKGAGRPMNGAH